MWKWYHNNPNHTIIVWGDASFQSSRKGTKTVPTSMLRRKVGARVKTLDHDEYRTSKLCSCCHEPLVAVKDSATHQTFWKVRRCNNNGCCRHLLDRNESAAINIGYLFQQFCETGQRQEAFRRKKDEEAEENESISLDHDVEVDSGQEEEEDGGEKDREEKEGEEDGGISDVPQALRLAKRARKN